MNRLASVDQFRAWVEGSQADATRVASLLQTTDPADADELIGQALDAATAIINGGSALAGYSVPIAPAEAGEQEDECEALAAKLCIAYALDQLSPSLPTQIQDGFKLAPRWHEQFMADLIGDSGFDGYGRLRRNLNPKASWPGLERSAA